MVAIEAEANGLIVPIVIDRVTFETGVIKLHGRLPRIAHVVQSSESPPPLVEDQPPPPSQGVTLTPSEYEEFLCLTHAAKSASIASVVLTGNVSTYLTHSLGQWILNSGASDHLSGNEDLFSSLTITLANGTQTMAKGIGSACPSHLYLLLLFSMSLILHLILSLSAN